MDLETLLAAYRSADLADAAPCFDITPNLAAGIALTEPQQRMVDLLDAAFASSPEIDQEAAFYRGCAPGEMEGEIYRPFISCSLELVEAVRFSRGCLAKIIVAPGLRILPISPPNGEVATLERSEYLLPRNLRIETFEWHPDPVESMLLGIFGETTPLGVRCLCKLA